MATSSLSHPIVTRKEASLQGLKSYFTGMPCKHGHVSPRNAGNGSCYECARFLIAALLNGSASRREDGRIRAANWYRDNRERALAKQTELRKVQDRKAVSAYNRRYREENIAAINEQQTLWVRGNMDRILATNHRRRAREKGSDGRYTPANIRNLLVAQCGLCVGIGCGKDIYSRYTVDHVIPLSRGGSNWPANLQLLCRSCNARKGTKTMQEWIEAVAA